MIAAKRPALFLDRDGVIVADVPFLHRVEDSRFLEGLFELIAAFAARDHAIVMATNQSAIGRDLYSEATFLRLTQWMRGEIEHHGGRLDAAYYAPTHPTEAKGQFRRDSTWRKPGPGMFLQAAADLGLDLTRSVSIGNELRDIEAMLAAGIERVFLVDAAATAAESHADGYRIVPRLVDVLPLP